MQCLRSPGTLWGAETKPVCGLVDRNRGLLVKAVSLVMPV